MATPKGTVALEKLFQELLKRMSAKGGAGRAIPEIEQDIFRRLGDLEAAGVSPEKFNQSAVLRALAAEQNQAYKTNAGQVAQNVPAGSALERVPAASPTSNNFLDRLMQELFYNPSGARPGENLPATVPRVTEMGAPASAGARTFESPATLPRNNPQLRPGTPSAVEYMGPSPTRTAGYLPSGSQAGPGAGYEFLGQDLGSGGRVYPAGPPNYPALPPGQVPAGSALGAPTVTNNPMRLIDALPYIIGGTGAGIGALNYLSSRPAGVEASSTPVNAPGVPAGPGMPTADYFSSLPAGQGQPNVAGPRSASGLPMSSSVAPAIRDSRMQQPTQLPNQQTFNAPTIGVTGANLSLGEQLGRPGVWGTLADVAGALDPYNRVAPIISQQARGQVFQQLLQQMGSTAGGGGANSAIPFGLLQLLGR